MKLPTPTCPSCHRRTMDGGQVFACERDCDVVVLKRGGKNEPGPDVLNAPGHVGFFAGLESRPRATFGDPDTGRVLVLGGNQADEVSVAPFPVERVLGVRRLIVEDAA